MSARLPGKCQSCGAHVELRLEGEVEERTFIPQADDYVVLQLPTAWCEPGTWIKHRCLVGASA